MVKARTNAHPLLGLTVGQRLRAQGFQFCQNIANLCVFLMLIYSTQNSMSQKLTLLFQQHPYMLCESSHVKGHQQGGIYVNSNFRQQS